MKAREVSPRAWLAALGGAFCLTIITVMLVRHAWPLWTGQSAYLRVEPVDPRDVFRGDYVILSYPIERLTIRGKDSAFGVPHSAVDESRGVVRPIGDAWWKGSQRELRGRTVYVQLEPDSSDLAGLPELHRAASVALEPQPDVLNLRGHIQYASTASLQVHYGIDAFFVREGTGRAIEDAIRQRTPVVAEVLIARSGVARVRDLIIDGKRVSEER